MRLIIELLGLLVRATALLLGLVGAGMGIACLGGVFSDRLDAFTHLSPLWLLMGGGAIVLGAIFARAGERWVVLGLGGTAIVACAVLIVPEYWAAWHFKSAAPVASDLKIIQFNVWYENRTPEKSLEWILAERADIVQIEEGGSDSLVITNGLRKAYPFSSCDEIMNCKTLIFSRKRMLDRGGLSPAAPPYLSGAWATIDDVAGAFTVAAVHYTWPVPAGLQQAQSRKLANLISKFDKKSMILTGDFNSTPWSFAMKRQDKALGLRRWTRALPSWPADTFSRILIASPPFLPIDHVYAGAKWRAVKVVRGPALGSDHRPIVVTLRRS